MVSINPFGYRGYVYDIGTGGLYYLQSRYYDPKNGATIKRHKLVYITQAMSFKEAFVWVAMQLSSSIFDNAAAWGLYTERHIDAYVMA